jgi:ferric-dicitrate binding protein FerR (iron transport regulator)
MNTPEEAIAQYLAGHATDEEIKLVNDWYYSFSNEEVELNVDEDQLRDKIRDRIQQRLQQTIHADKTRSSRSFYSNRMKWLAAAVVLFMVFTAGYLLVTIKGKDIQQVEIKKVEELSKPIVPGGDKAVLTLADGSQIVLDSAQAGMLTQQGGTRIIKLNNGRVAYNINHEEHNVNSAPAYNTITTPRGGQYNIVLSDGTEVWLNSASTLRFPAVFTAASREVFLTGEGYFEVKHQLLGNGNKKPFIVQVNQGSRNSVQVTVLGTKFNIMGYGDEETIKTTLVEGSVQATGNSDKVLIKPGQQAGLNNNDNHFKVSNPDLREVLAWKNGEFRFKETNIRDIMRQLARWYDVDLEFRGDVNDITLSGVMPKKENIRQLLEVLETTGRVHFEINGNKVITMPK